MATKKQVNEAYFQGCCDILEQLSGVTGINIGEIEIDIHGLEKFATENGYDGVLSLLGEKP